MDDGEVDFSNQEIFSGSNMGEFPSSSSMSGFLDELLKDAHACTHTHTCNPPGPDFSHTHTCFHVHTKIVPATPEDKVGSDDTAESSEKSSKKRPLGNREAVRKYREKKKARAATLEDENVRLKAVNQQLLKKLQSQPALEAEVARLKCLLVDIRGRIEGEIGSFPYQKPANHSMGNFTLPGAYVMNQCNVPCDDQLFCLRPEMEGKFADPTGLNAQEFSHCDFGDLQCSTQTSTGLNDCCGVGHGNAPTNAHPSGGSKGKGTTRSATAG